MDDDDTGPILRAKEEDAQPDWQIFRTNQRELTILWAQWDSPCTEKGTLYRVWESENGQNEHLQIVVPRLSVPKVLHSIHDRVSGGHLGVTKAVVKL